MVLSQDLPWFGLGFLAATAAAEEGVVAPLPVSRHCCSAAGQSMAEHYTRAGAGAGRKSGSRTAGGDAWLKGGGSVSYHDQRAWRGCCRWWKSEKACLPQTVDDSLLIAPGPLLYQRLKRARPDVNTVDARTASRLVAPPHLRKIATMKRRLDLIRKIDSVERNTYN